MVSYYPCVSGLDGRLTLPARNLPRLQRPVQAADALGGSWRPVQAAHTRVPVGLVCSRLDGLLAHPLGFGAQNPGPLFIEFSFS